jgi:hypothetical protein
VEGVFAKKFQVRETIPLSALAFGRSHALVAEGFNNKGRRPATRSTRATADGEITWDTRSWDASASVPKPEERTSVNFRSSLLPPPEDPFC